MKLVSGLLFKETKGSFDKAKEFIWRLSEVCPMEKEIK